MAADRKAQTRVGTWVGFVVCAGKGKKSGSEYQMMWLNDDSFIDRKLRGNKAKLNPVRPPRRL